jgi:transcriptional regulator with XRE-family HTH domain
MKSGSRGRLRTTHQIPRSGKVDTDLLQKMRYHLTLQRIDASLPLVNQRSAKSEARSGRRSLLGDVLAKARHYGGVDVPAGISIRELARRAEVSAAQISRIEAGHVLKPSREILVALGRALNRNPLPLLVLAGHLEGAEAQTALRPYFRDGAELPEEWGDWASLPLDVVRHRLQDPEATDDDIRQIAADIFSVAETDETLWDDSHALALGRGTDAAQLLELMGIWRYIGDRRAQFLEYGRSLRLLADLEYLAEAEAIDLRITADKNKEENQ